VPLDPARLGRCAQASSHCPSSSRLVSCPGGKFGRKLDAGTTSDQGHRGIGRAAMFAPVAATPAHPPSGKTIEPQLHERGCSAFTSSCFTNRCWRRHLLLLLPVPGVVGQSRQPRALSFERARGYQAIWAQRSL